MKVHLSRFLCQDVPWNLRRMEEESAEAARVGADLCVFPEAFLHGYTRRADPAELRERFASVSSQYPGTVYVFGSFTEARKNRMTLWQGGRELGSYDKVHLFGPNEEARLWDPGESYAAVKCQGWTLGLLNCNDLRFPEQARALRLKARCDALLAIAWWPWRRDHVWKTLLRARAMENGVYVLGCSIAASAFPGEEFHGAGNYVFDPLGEPVRTRDDRMYEMDRARLEQVIVDPLQTWVEIAQVRVQGIPSH